MMLERAQRRDVERHANDAVAPDGDAAGCAVPGRTTRMEQLFATGAYAQPWNDRTPHVARVPGRTTRVACEPTFPDEYGRLPGHLRRGIEALSGVAMDDVRVHHDSARPAALGAAAYAHGSDIYLGPGQDHQLGHEAWHVVQQKQGRVAVSWRLGSAGLNIDDSLEREADVMAARALALDHAPQPAPWMAAPRHHAAVYQLAPLGDVEHIRSSCFIATIIHCFAVTPALLNLLNPGANDVSTDVPRARLQNLLYRAVNTVDAQQLVTAEWVAGIMTELVANDVIQDPISQDVNEVMRTLVVMLQAGNEDRIQPDGMPTYAGEIMWRSNQTIPKALESDNVNGVAFDVLNPASVIHVVRGYGNRNVAPPSFTVNLPADGASLEYQLRAAVRRDVGAYDAAHFVSYANRGTHAAPEWHENDDVGPQHRQVSDAATQAAPQSAPKTSRRAKTPARGRTSKRSGRVAASPPPEPVAPANPPADFRQGAAMYIYEKAGATAQAAPAGATQTVSNDAAHPDPTAFTRGYYLMRYARRGSLDSHGKTALRQVFARCEGFEAELQQLQIEIVGEQRVERARDALRTSAATLLGLTTDQLAEVSGLSVDELAKLPVEDAYKTILDAYGSLLKKARKGKQPGSTASHQVPAERGQALLSRVDQLLDRCAPKDIAAFTDEELLLLRSWDGIPIQLRGVWVQKGELRQKQHQFLALLNDMLDDHEILAALEPEEQDRLRAIHFYLGADAAVSSGGKVRGDEHGIPDESAVTFDKGYTLFAESALSDTEDDPVEPEEHAARARNNNRFSVFSTATFGNHVPQIEDERVGRDNYSGLGPANTSAFLMRGNQFVPRMTGALLAPTPNRDGHRRKLGVLGEAEATYGKDTAHGKLDELVQEQHEVFERNPKRVRWAKGETENQRRSVRYAVSGHLIWTEQSRLRDAEVDDDLEREREALAEGLTRDANAEDTRRAEWLIKRYTGKRAGSLGHAESQTVRTQLWRSLTQRVLQIVATEGTVVPGDVCLQLFLNRSNCEGCARRLVLEAIRFWGLLAQAMELGDWRAARDRFRGDALLQVGFSSTYGEGRPKTFRAIATGLLDAGWSIRLLPRHKSTAEFSRQSTSTLHQLDKVVRSFRDPAVRQQLMWGDQLETQIGDAPSLKDLFASRGAKRKADDAFATQPDPAPEHHGAHETVISTVEELERTENMELQEGAEGVNGAFADLDEVEIAQDADFEAEDVEDAEGQQRDGFGLRSARFKKEEG